MARPRHGPRCFSYVAAVAICKLERPKAALYFAPSAPRPSLARVLFDRETVRLRGCRQFENRLAFWVWAVIAPRRTQSCSGSQRHPLNTKRAPFSACASVRRERGDAKSSAAKARSSLQIATAATYEKHRGPCQGRAIRIPPLAPDAPCARSGSFTPCACPAPRARSRRRTRRSCRGRRAGPPGRARARGSSASTGNGGRGRRAAASLRSSRAR